MESSPITRIERFERATLYLRDFRDALLGLERVAASITGQPYGDPLGPLAKIFTPGAEKPVQHRETCPSCDRKLVNLYRRDGEWRCKKCWDKEEEGEIDETET